MKHLHLFLALFTATLFLACSADKEQLQVETDLTTSSEERVDLSASGAKAYSWRQISGTPVILINANSATASFIAPDLVTEETLVFELEVVTAKVQGENFTLTKQVSVVVHPKATGDMDSTSPEVKREQPEQPKQDAETGATDVHSNTPTQTHEVNSTDMHSTSGEVEREASSPDTNTTPTKETNSTTQTTPTSNTQTDATLKSLKLTLEKNSLNVDENTTLEVVANYEDNTAKDVTNQVEWNLSDATTAQITNKTLHAKKDTNIFIQAKLGTISSNTLALEIYKEISGHRLPPEPNPIVNNSTLLGIDSNNNGVRDDVERWIYEEYKEKHPIHIDIAMQAGRAYKQVLETPERALEIHETVVNAPLYCAWYYQYDADRYNDPLLINERIDAPVKSKYFNTKKRSDVYWQYDTLLSGGSYTLPKTQEMKAMCDFNTTKYEE